MTSDQLERLRAICTQLPGVEERPSHGEPSWFAGGKRMFVTFADHHHDDRLAFWCAAPEGAQRSLVESDPERFFIPPYVGRRGWVGCYLDRSIDWELLEGIVTDAYLTIAPARLRRQVPDGLH